MQGGGFIAFLPGLVSVECARKLRAARITNAMGLVRLILALSVLIAHCPPGVLPAAPVNANLAVQCFYVISGFYIQLIIREKFSAQEKGWQWNFYKSRIARIFPVYYLFTVPFLLLLGNDFLAEHWKAGDMLSVAGFIYSNLFLVPLDFYYIFRVSLAFMGFYIPPAHSLFINPPAWTLTLELTFYLLAPLLLRRSARLLTFMAATLAALRVVCMRWEEAHPTEFHTLFPDGLNHFVGYFPFELSLFLAGSLSYRVYAAILLKKPWRKSGGRIYERIRAAPANSALYAFSGIVWLAFLRYLWREWAELPDRIGPVALPSAYWTVIIVTILALPFVFHFTRFMRWDRYIGELSYPVYLGHFLVLKLVEKYGGVRQEYKSTAVLIITLLVSVGAWRLVEVPVSLWRHKRFEKTPVER
jgi:peptidoglycan/LPS O-acetylase OafA/YrhL